jgi:hypothetical protein
MSERLWHALAAGAGDAVKDAVSFALAAGLPCLVFYVLFRRRLARRKVVPRLPPWRQLGAEAARWREQRRRR